MATAPRGAAAVWWRAWVALCVPRLLSALYNNIHDCDEVFNYWEPLHYLLYGQGLQTWEYSAQFCLRSYAYLALHALPALPLRLLLGPSSPAGRRGAFLLVRAALGLLCAASEASMCAAMRVAVGHREATALLVVFATSVAMFCASTTFLPSSFSMCGLAFAVSLSLLRRHRAAVHVAAVSALLGWPFAGLACVPVGLYAIGGLGLVRTVLHTSIAGLLTVLGTAVVDRLAYGRWTSSVVNISVYNWAGGDSTLYGVEGPFFYLKNLLINFHVVFLLALVLPVLGLVAPRLLSALGQAAVRRDKKTDAKLGGSWTSPALPPFVPALVCVSPFYLWALAVSALPHKEERFMYLVYPQLCAAASIALGLVVRVAETMDDSWAMARRLGKPLARACVAVAFVAAAAVSLSRVVALHRYYGAPMTMYRHLPHSVAVSDAGQPIATVCVGAEWHRFPSSFFFPDSSYRIGFLESGFHGLLPSYFRDDLGGTASAPAYLNDRNEENTGAYTKLESCHFVMELRKEAPAVVSKGIQEGRLAGPEVSTAAGSSQWSWEPVATLPFLDAERSPSLTRALYLPFLSPRHNTFGTYILWGRAAALP